MPIRCANNRSFSSISSQPSAANRKWAFRSASTWQCRIHISESISERAMDLNGVLGSIVKNSSQVTSRRMLGWNQQAKISITSSSQMNSTPRGLRQHANAVARTARCSLPWYTFRWRTPEVLVMRAGISGGNRRRRHEIAGVPPRQASESGEENGLRRRGDATDSHQRRRSAVLS